VPGQHTAETIALTTTMTSSRAVDRDLIISAMPGT
jgi:hypothetical protein